MFISTVLCRTVAVVALVSAAVPLGAGGWPQWRGPNSQGVSADAGFPTAWSPTASVAWKTPLPGSGLSSPIVLGDYAFVTAQVEGAPISNPGAVTRSSPDPQSVGTDRRHALQVIALDVRTGRIRWTRTAHDGPMYDARFARSSYAAATPVTDGSLVFAYFGPEGLFAYDYQGRLAWRVIERFKTRGVGAATSPILHEEFVIVQRDEEDGAESVIVAYDRRTGREAWRTRRAVQMSWSTPVLVEVEGRTELVTNGHERIIAYDPATGRELWSVGGLQGGAMHTPLVSEGLVIVTAGCQAKKVIALRPGAKPAAEERAVWEYAKGTGCPLSNLAYRGRVFLFTESGIVTVLDTRTGEVLAQGIRPPVPAQFTASPVAYGDLIALTSEEGDTFMLHVDGEPAFVRTNGIGESVRASLALADGRILIRTDRHLVAIAR